MKFEIKHRFSGNILFSIETDNFRLAIEAAVKSDANLRNADLSDADLSDANLRNADLSDADLINANLINANLRNANLRNANLSDAKNYSENHDFFFELIRRKKRESFSTKQWAIMGQIAIHRLCWESIMKPENASILSVLEELEKDGFGEYLKKFREEA
jgi:hypothetical protein